MALQNVRSRRITTIGLVAVAALIPVTAMAATASGSPGRAGAPAAVPKCGTAALEVWLGVKGEARMGNYLYPLEVTNVSGSTCTTSGFTSVSAYSVADASATGGHQIGRAARRSGKPRLVTLRPGATAHQWLDITNVSDYTKAECHQVTAPALKILPAGPKSVEVSFSFGACAAKKFSYMFLDPLRPGLAVPPAYS